MNYVFYESSRIIDKQEKYEKIRAYRVIDSLEKDGLSDEKMLTVINLLIGKTQLDFEKSVLSKAINIINARKEKNETSTTIDDNSINRLPK
jgi:hypothetical protein